MIPDKPPQQPNAFYTMLIAKVIAAVSKDNMDWVRHMKDHPTHAAFMSAFKDFCRMGMVIGAVCAAIALPHWFRP